MIRSLLLLLILSTALTAAPVPPPPKPNPCGQVSINMYIQCTTEVQANGLTNCEPLTVIEIVKGSTAERVFKVGDYIRKVNGKELEANYDLFILKSLYRPGAKVKVELVRDKKTIEVIWELEEDMDVTPPIISIDY